MGRDKFPEGTELIYGKPWTPRMVREYRSLSLYKYNKLRAQFSMKDILLKHGVVANNLRRRRFVDRSDTVVYEGRTWTLAQIYMLVTENEYSHDRVRYKLFAQRVRNELRIVDSRREAIDNVIERMGYASLSLSMHNMTDDKYKRISQNYVDYISNQRERQLFNMQAQVTDAWERCARVDPKMRWYLYELHDEVFAEISKKYEALKNTHAAQYAELVQLRTEQLELTKQIMEYRENARHISANATPRGAEATPQAEYNPGRESKR